MGRWRQRAPDGAPVHYERHRLEQTTLYRLVQQHAATFIAQAEAHACADLPQFFKDGFDAFLECGILAHGFLRLRCGDCGVSVPQSHPWRDSRPTDLLSYTVAVAAAAAAAVAHTAVGTAVRSGGCQLCGRIDARSLFFSVGRRSNTSLR